MRTIWITLRTSLVLILLCGVVYNLAVLGIAQVIAPDKADGSLVYNDRGEVVGSKLIGQSFTDQKYFQSRPSSINYDAANSGSPNYAPSNKEMLKRTQDAVNAWKVQNPDVSVNQLPVDLITNSSSGLDPQISVAAAEAQIPRISKLTGVEEDILQKLVDRNTEGPGLGIFGEQGVNVLLLNMDLQKELSHSK